VSGVTPAADTFEDHALGRIDGLRQQMHAVEELLVAPTGANLSRASALSEAIPRLLIAIGKQSRSGSPALRYSVEHLRRQMGTAALLAAHAAALWQGLIRLSGEAALGNAVCPIGEAYTPGGTSRPALIEHRTLGEG